MAESLGSRIQHAWSVFRNGEHSRRYGASYSGLTQSTMYGSQGRQYSRRPGDRSIVTSIYNRMAVDAAAVDIRHARLGKNLQFLETIPSKLHNCLTLDPNLDQSARAFKHDLVMTMFEEGHAVVVPTDTTINPTVGSYDILSLRVGVVTDWYAEHVNVRLYNQQNGQQEEIILPKKTVAIIENPFYSVMNEHNSTLQRLIRKLYLLDAIDEQLNSGKLDIIIQLPYSIRHETRKKEAEKRRKEIEMQLKNAQYGIAYIDGTETVTQLNRPAENNLLKQIEWLTTQLYEQLSMTPEVVSGTADEQTMLNYYTRTIDPIMISVTEEFSRKFLTQTGRTQGQWIRAMRNPFGLASTSNVAEMADKFTRNEILTSNEFRGIIGYYPSEDPKADKLRNANISAPKEESVSITNQIKEGAPGENSSDAVKAIRELPGAKKKELLEGLLLGPGNSPNGRPYREERVQSK